MVYELTLVLPGSSTAAKKKAVVGNVEKMVKVYKGEVKKSAEWGKIDLAYPIKKNNSGVFLNFDLELDPESARNLKDKLKVEDAVIRHLLVRKD